MECRAGCGACCIAPSISSPLPGLPQGKPAGMPCPHLTDDYLCALFDRPERPAVCQAFSATAELCGTSRAEALVRLASLERMTGDDGGPRHSGVEPEDPGVQVGGEADPGEIGH